MAGHLIMIVCLLALNPLIANAIATVYRHTPANGRWIVTLKRSLTPEQFEAHLNWVQSIAIQPPRQDRDVAILGNTFDFGDLKGYAGTFGERVIDQIALNDNVDFIEPNYAANIETTLAPIPEIPEPSNVTIALPPAASIEVQPEAPWGLARISSRDTPFLSAKSNAAYRFKAASGEGVWAYVLDSGLHAQHEDFEGRAEFAVNLANQKHENDFDHHGHGTWVAGIIGAVTYGVAKKTNIVGVKVITGQKNRDFEGSIIDGLNWVRNHILKNNREKNSVINVSLAPRGLTLALVVKSLTEMGVFVGLSAGNDQGYVSSDSLRSIGCIAGATAKDDTPMPMSNYGPGVAIYAPGVGIESTSSRPGIYSMIGTGTSAASPFVVGMAAYLISTEGFIPANALCQRIKDLGTRGKIFTPIIKPHSRAVQIEPDILLYNGIDEAVP